MIFVIFLSLSWIETFLKLLNMQEWQCVLLLSLILTTMKGKTYHMYMSTTIFVGHFSFRLTSGTEWYFFLLSDVVTTDCCVNTIYLYCTP